MHDAHWTASGNVIGDRSMIYGDRVIAGRKRPAGGCSLRMGESRSGRYSDEEKRANEHVRMLPVCRCSAK
jgi:hypothetical protein